MTGKPLRIGTRDSILATWQARFVRERLMRAGCPCELRFIKTEGDRVLDTPLPLMGGKGVFTKALDDALLSGEIDLAVHSLKDIPTRLPSGLAIGAVSEREDPADVLVTREAARAYLSGSGVTSGTGTAPAPGHSISSGSGAASGHNLPGSSGLRIPDPAPPPYLKDPEYRAVIASSSNRRIGQWLSRYPRHRVTDIRGNVQTRLRKLAESDWDGAIFAAAGLVRLGLQEVMSVRLDWMLPAPAQGAMAVMIRDDDQRLREALTNVHDPDSALCTGIERDVLHALEGGCSAPVGAIATVDKDVVHFHLAVVYPDGTGFLSFEMSDVRATAKDLGRRAADEALRRGADVLIRDLRGDGDADKETKNAGESESYSKADSEPDNVTDSKSSGMRVSAGAHKSREMAATRLAISTRTVTSGEVALARRHGIRLMDYPVWQYRWSTPPPHVTSTVLAEEPQAWVFTSRRGVEGWWRIWREQLRKQKLRSEILGKTLRQGQGGQTRGGQEQGVAARGGQAQGGEAQGGQAQGGEVQVGQVMRIPLVYAVGDATADAVRRFFGESVTGETGISQGGTDQADSSQGEIAQSDTGQADFSQSDAAQSETDRSNTAQENGNQNDIGQIEIRVAERGDGKSLGEALLRDGVRSAVHFCAVERRTELAEACMKHGIALTEAEVYQRIPVSNRKPLFTAFDALLFFSPDGVTEFFRVYGVPGGSWRPVAVGQTTAEAIRQETGLEPLIAASPSFGEMLKLV